MVWGYKSGTHFQDEFGDLSYGWTHHVGFSQLMGRVLQILAVIQAPQGLGIQMMVKYLGNFSSTIISLIQ